MGWTDGCERVRRTCHRRKQRRVPYSWTRIHPVYGQTWSAGSKRPRGQGWRLIFDGRTAGPYAGWDGDRYRFTVRAWRREPAFLMRLGWRHRAWPRARQCASA